MNLVLASILTVTLWGNSMSPTIHNGQVIKVDTSIKYQDLKVGDIVYFYSPMISQIGNFGPGMSYQSHNWMAKDCDYRVIHRLTRKDFLHHFHTKGDNNMYEDAVVMTKNNYIGLVIK
jgi:hypothetical protein